MPARHCRAEMTAAERRRKMFASRRLARLQTGVYTLPATSMAMADNHPLNRGRLVHDGGRHPLRRFGTACLALALVCAGGAAGATPCFWQALPGAEVTLHCNRQPCTLTVSPDGRGETLEEAGITLRLRLYCDYFGDDRGPMAGVPAEEILLWMLPSSPWCACAGKIAARATDENGYTEFSGTFLAGGCVENLDLFVDGVFSTTIPLRINSPDFGVSSPCYVDAADLANLTMRLGHPERYTFCADFDESGSVDDSDLAYFAAALGRACP